jgi:quinol-cytochrome oxidoreductase complex cytochrome b subunit
MDRTFSRFDRWAASTWGEGINPFARLGALAVTSIFIAILSGTLLLLFYDVSVHSAYESVRLMLGRYWWFAGILHSVHRYSADAAMLFTLLHLFRILAIKAFTGGRAMSWATGVLAFGLLWLVGWTGFWLVWDQTGFLVAQFSARLLDVIPIFGTPLSRGLLLDKSVNNQIFFVVFLK